MNSAISLFSSTLILLLFASCCEETMDDPFQPNCTEEIVMDSAAYKDAPADEFSFETVRINGDCLEMTIRYGGGCGDVVLKLIDAEEIMESFPVQRRIRLSLEDNDPCKALLTKEISFDLTPVQLEEYDVIKLNLSGWGEQLVYEY